MNVFRTMWLRLRSLWQQKVVKEEIDEELQFHLEMREQELLKTGMSPKEAALEARRRFGNIQCVREDCRDLKGADVGDSVARDVRFGVRMLRKNPVFTVVAALTLALGIGINTSMFSTLKVLLFSRLPFPDPDRLVRVCLWSHGESFYNHTAADFYDEREQSGAVECVSAYKLSQANLSDSSAPAEGVLTLQATADIFKCLGVSPILGRGFTIENEEPGRHQTIVLNHAFWLRRFGGDTNIVGRTLRLDGEIATIVGVLPRNFDCTLLFGMQVDLVRPLALDARMKQDRSNQWLQSVIGRLKPGVSLSQAQSEWKILSARWNHDHPKVEWDRQLVPLSRSLMNRETTQIIWMLFGMTGVVLLIACFNLANLQLSRMAARTRELGIRAALGAGRARLARQLLTESLILASLGGVLGLLLALVCNHVLSRQFVIDSSHGLHLAIPIDPAVIVFTFVSAVASGILVGTAPAWLVVRGDMNPALKENGRGACGGGPRHRLQSTLIVGEIAMALVLLACTGELGLGIVQSSMRNPGWTPSGLLVGEVLLSGPEYRSYEKLREFSRTLEERLEHLPGVKSVSLSSELPIEKNCCWHVVVDGQPRTEEHMPLVFWHYVSLDYFGTMEIPILRGRKFTTAEIVDSRAVVIINDGMAKALWPKEDPIGKRVAFSDDNPQWMEVVGVTADIPDANGFHACRPLGGTSGLSITVRASQEDAGALASTLRQTVAEVDPNLPVRRVQTATHILEERQTNDRVIVLLIGLFGFLGLVLAAIGVYGVTANLVTQRTSEFGIRMALGAPRSHVLWLVLRGGLRLSLVGAFLGIIGGIAMLRVFNSVCSGLSDVNASTIFGVPVVVCGAALISAAVLITVALLACWVPARRATKIDPMLAVRCEG